MVTEACEDVTHHLMHLQKGFILDPTKKGSEEATQIGLLISYCKQAADSSTQSTLTGQWDLWACVCFVLRVLSDERRKPVSDMPTNPLQLHQ
jgi:hypothetical protein